MRCQGTRARRVDASDVQAPARQHAGEGAGTAAEIEHAARTELGGHGRVDIQVTAIRIKRVVDACQPRMLEDRVSHGVEPTSGKPDPAGPVPG